MLKEKGITFLIVDDIANILDSLEADLKNLNPGNSIIKANSVKEAKTIFEKNHDKIEFIISDWHMPEETGMVLLKYIRFDKNLKNIPFVVLTTSNEKNAIMEAITLGVSSYILKPWKKDELFEKLEVVWKKHHP